MLRFLHAADFHLDSAFAALDGAQAAQRRREQREQLTEIAALANETDLLLLSGDLLDSTRPYRDTKEALESFFAALRVPCFLAPGNHDYLTPQSPYQHIRLPENVHLFRDTQPEGVPLPELGCTVWGAAFLGERAPALLRGFHAPEDGSCHLMVLHGDVRSGESAYSPIREEEIAASGLCYVALGHIHSFSGLRRAGKTFWAYPGCPMGRGFDETGEKGVLLGSLEAGECSLRFLPLHGRRYERLLVDVTGADDLEAALEAALPKEWQTAIVRLILCGELPEPPALERLRSALADCCWHLELRDETRPTQDIWQAAAEETLRGAFLRLLRARYEAAGPEERERLALAARYGLAALEGREEPLCN